jgi:hypothetical protein
LTVNGTTTNINSTNLVVEDKNIVLGDTTTPTDTTADGGGITLKGATDKTFNWVDATDAWTSSEHINLASGKSLYLNGTLLKDVTETLTNKTLTSPTITTGTASQTVLLSPEERWNVVAAAATGTINIDATTAGVWYYTSDATANHTLNLRGSSSATLDSILAVGDSISIVWLNTNGATPYFPNVIQIDGATNNRTLKWQNATAPSAGNASGVDAYIFTIAKTASNTFQVFGSSTRFA